MTAAVDAEKIAAGQLGERFADPYRRDVVVRAMDDERRTGDPPQVVYALLAGGVGGWCVCRRQDRLGVGFQLPANGILEAFGRVGLDEDLAPEELGELPPVTTLCMFVV
jgi:hypothetical protein